MTKKKLTRDRESMMLGGVLSGFAKYIGAEISLVRLGYIFLALVSGIFPGIILYFAAWIIIPEK